MTTKMKKYKQSLPHIGDLLCINLHHKKQFGVVIHDGCIVSLNIDANNSWSDNIHRNESEIIVLVQDFSLYSFGRWRMLELINQNLITIVSKFEESIS